MPLNPSDGRSLARIAIVTRDGRAYYLAAQLLRELGLRYQSLTPSSLEPEGYVVLTTSRERRAIRKGRVLVLEELLKDRHRARQLLVDSLIGEGEHELIIGLDPGKRIGLVAFYGPFPVEVRVHERPSEIVRTVLSLVRASPARVRRVRVGNGDQERARRLLAALLPRLKGTAIIELVDERGSNYTHPALASELRRDARAAAAIAFRQGVILAGG
ncbi:MAG: hypothetical protein C4339_03740 [Nitrososphaerota archaeon]